MCGRTCLTIQKDQVECACSYKPKSSSKYTKPEWLHEHNGGKEYTPSHNIAPTDVTPVLISSSKYKNSAKTERILKPMMWGIIPPWHKSDHRPHNLSTNNCMIENILDSKLYSPILKNGGRCVVVVEGFYEWQTTVKTKVKQPYYIYAQQSDSIKIEEHASWNNSYSDEEGFRGIQLLHMAGLYSAWHNGNTIIYAYSVITMESNRILDWLHHRTPAILETEEQINAWLDIDSVDYKTALGYLKPVNFLVWHKVSTIVNNSRNKSDACNKRVEQKSSQMTITKWFKKREKRNSSDEISPPPPCKKFKDDK